MHVDLVDVYATAGDLPARRSATTSFHVATCSASSQMVCAPFTTRFAAIAGVTPSSASSNEGPCQASAR